MNETLVTLQGRVGGDVSLRQAGDSVVASFRVGCTPRRFHKKSGEWVDADTQWYTVTAWRTLGENCHASLQRGDAVLVVGRLNAQTWTNNAGMEVTTFEVEAMSVGPDLTRGTSRFVRRVRDDAPVEGSGHQGVDGATAAAPSSIEPSEAAVTAA